MRGQVYLLASAAGNALIQVGAQGVLVVDTMREQDADQLLAAIKRWPGTGRSATSSTRMRIRITPAAT